MKIKQIFSKQVLIGIFTVAVILGAYFGLNFLKSKRVFSDDIVLYAVFPQADGIEVSSPVVIKGFKIGTIDKVSFNIKTSQVVVQMTVDNQYPLPNSSAVQITSTSILGGKVIEVQLGAENDEKLTNGDTIRAIFAPSLTESLGEEYGKLKLTATEIVDKLNVALDGINRVLSENNTQAISATLENLRSISANIDEVINKESANINKVIENLAALSASLKKMTPDIERGVKNISTLTDTLKTQAPMLIANATGAISNLNSILYKVNNGSGSAAKLVNDAELYENLNQAIQSLGVLLEDLKANPKRYINVTVFGKKEKADK